MDFQNLGQKLPIFQVVLQPHCDLSTNILQMKQDSDLQKKTANAKGPLQSSCCQNLVNFGPQTAES